VSVALIGHQIRGPEELHIMDITEEDRSPAESSSFPGTIKSASLIKEALSRSRRGAHSLCTCQSFSSDQPPQQLRTRVFSNV
jgi:hypothetical protein